MESIVDQRVAMRARDEVNRSAAPAIATARTAARNEFLATKGETAVASAAGLDADVNFVDEH